MKNYTELFEDFLDLIEFTLVKHKNPSLVLQYKDIDGKDVVEERNGVWSVWDRQGANLGDIDKERFEHATQIIGRFDIYINDYIYRALEEELDAYDVELDVHEIPWGAEEWLELINSDDFRKERRNLRYIEEHKWEFDVLDMIAYHTDEINLEECFYEEEE